MNRHQSQLKTEKVGTNERYLLHEDPRKSRFSHSRLMSLEKISCLLAMLIFFLSCTKTEMDISDYDPSRISSRYIMNAMSACTLGLSTPIIIKSLSSPCDISQNSSCSSTRTSSIFENIRINHGCSYFSLNQKMLNIFSFKS